jgi:hypothetical protein
MHTVGAGGEGGVVWVWCGCGVGVVWVWCGCGVGVVWVWCGCVWCGVWCGCGVGVWCVVCGVWCVVCGVGVTAQVHAVAHAVMCLLLSSGCAVLEGIGVLSCRMIEAVRTFCNWTRPQGCSNSTPLQPAAFALQRGYHRLP